MLEIDSYSSHISARVLNFCSSQTRWNRQLWNVGLLLALREILEASEAVRAGVLSQESLRRLTIDVMRQAGSDPGAGSSEQRNLVERSLKSELTFRGAQYRAIGQLVPDIEANYLARWAVSLRDKTVFCRPERCARAIASHLLDCGYSPDFLHRWWTFKVRHEKGAQSLSDVVDDAHSLARRPMEAFLVLVAFQALPGTKSNEMPEGWLNAEGVSNWLRDRSFDVGGLRQGGGTLIRVDARDSWSAVETAVERVDRLVSRVMLGTHRRLRPVEWAWLEGHKQPFALRRRQRSVDVRALDREGQLYTEHKESIVDAALELLGPLSTSSPAPAVTGAWAAVEALLSAPGDAHRGTAGERMASLVACSFPRAELTDLSYRTERLTSSIVRQLSQATTNRDRSQILASAIREGEGLSFLDPSDAAAFDRMKAVVENPRTALRDIGRHIGSVFRRVYRQRNLVLHGGRTDAVALRASLRTAAPLIGAGMDRIAHAWFVEHVVPLELATRAEIRLQLLGTPNAPEIVDLLDSVSR